MYTDGFQLINTKCSKLLEREPKWKDILDMDSTQCANRIKDELKSHFEIVTQLREEQSDVVIGRLHPMLQLVDLGVVHLTDLVLLCQERLSEELPVLWHQLESTDETPKPSFVLEVLATNLSNTLLSVRTLTCLGLDGASKALARFFAELADIIVLITADQEFYKQYVEASESFESSYKHWRESLSPGKARNRLRCLDQTIGMDSELQKVTANLREETYQWLSSFTHANWVAQAVSAHSRDFD